MSTEITDIKSQESWEQKFQALQNKYNTIQQEKEQIKKEKEEIEKKYREVTKQTSDKNSKNKHDNAFWKMIQDKIYTDTDSIKVMIKNKTLGLSDTDRFDMNILILASVRLYSFSFWAKFYQ